MNDPSLLVLLSRVSSLLPLFTCSPPRFAFKRQPSRASQPTAERAELFRHPAASRHLSHWIKTNDRSHLCEGMLPCIFYADPLTGFHRFIQNLQVTPAVKPCQWLHKKMTWPVMKCNTNDICVRLLKLKANCCTWRPFKRDIKMSTFTSLVRSEAVGPNLMETGG